MKKPVRLTILLIAGLIVVFAQMSRAQTPGATGTTWPNCGAPTKITLSAMESGNLNKTPDKRSLNPLCKAYYELDEMKIDSVYTGDCNAVASGYCDVHLRFSCEATPGCLFEIDQTWLAAGVRYPTGCSNAFGGVYVCVKVNDVVSAKGFFFIDAGGIHEFHPVASISVGSRTSLITSPTSPVANPPKFGYPHPYIGLVFVSGRMSTTMSRSDTGSAARTRFR